MPLAMESTDTRLSLNLNFDLTSIPDGRHLALDVSLERLLAAALAAASGSCAFVRVDGMGGATPRFLGRSESGPWTEEVPPIVEDAIDRAASERSIVHVEGAAIGAEFGDAEGVEAILAVPLPIVLQPAAPLPGAAVRVPGLPACLGALAIESSRSIEPVRQALMAIAAEVTAVIVADRLRRRLDIDVETGLPLRAPIEAALEGALQAGAATLALLAPSGGAADVVRLAAALTPATGSASLTGRWASDRLAVVLPRPVDATAAQTWIESAAAAGLPLSVGLATGAGTPGRLVVQATEALAASRRLGPGQAAVWAESMAGLGLEADPTLGGDPSRLAAAIELGLAPATPSDAARRALEILTAASGAGAGRIALGRSADGLAPPDVVDADRAAEAFGAASAGVLWRRKGGRGRGGVRLTLALPAAVGPVGAVELEFEGDAAGDTEPLPLYAARALARPLGLAIERALLAEEAARLRERLPPEPTVDEKGKRTTGRKALPRGRASLKYDYTEITGDCSPMIEVFSMLDKVIDSNVPVLILGESGTGKELIARAIHFKGPRKKAAYVSENCAAVTETLLESELFGYVKGAFTGASGNKRGLFEVADGGTLFLDEVGDMSPGMQKKLLRALQEGEIRPVGGKSVKHVDTRVIAATNRDLQKMMKEGTFREDLFYRLNVVSVNLPPLRERNGDVRILLDFFLKKTCREMGVERKVDDEAMACLLAYRWPGNIRELENEVKRIVALSDDRIDKALLSPGIQEAKRS